MVVIAIISSLMAVVVGAFRSGMSAASPTHAAELASASVLAARSQALTLRSGSRVVIDAIYDPEHSNRYLRRVTIERKETNPSGEELWVQTGMAVTLPAHTFFSTDYSSGYEILPAPDTGKLVYEFDAAGRLDSAGGVEARMVFVVGTLDSAGMLETPTAMLPKRNGFIIRQAGRVAHFQTPDQIIPAQQ